MTATLPDLYVTPEAPNVVQPVPNLLPHICMRSAWMSTPFLSHGDPANNNGVVDVSNEWREGAHQKLQQSP